MKRLKLLLAMLIFAGFGVAVPARADFVFYTGIHGGNQGTNNVLYNGGADIPGPALNIRGHIQDGPPVDFIGLEGLIVPGGGQARIEAADGRFTDLLILLPMLPGGSFTKAIFNLDALANGQVAIGVVDREGIGASGTFALDKNGGNFITIIATEGHGIREITIDSTVDLADIEQVRLGGRAINVVAEPGSIVLLGTLLLGAGVIVRRRSS